MDDLAHNLSIFAWNGIEFPAEDITTTFGHDSAQHKGYRVHGADVETTGPKAKVIRVKAVLLNGLRGWTGAPLFPDTYQQLTRELEENAEGQLSHPTRGVFTAHFDEASEEIRPTVRSGLTIVLSFTEQRGEAELLQFAPRTPSTEATTAAQTADEARPAAVKDKTSLGDDLLEMIDFLEAEARSYAEAVAAFDATVEDIRSRLRDPAAAVVDAHPFREALYATLAAVQSYRESYLGAEPRTYVVVEEASVARIAALPEVYGDASRGAELMAANGILDPSRVPVGTRLLVVD